MTKKKPPGEPRGKPGRPPGGKGVGGQMKCPAGHTANQDGKCFESSCEHYVRK